MSRARQQTCNWCPARAVYEHPHVMDPPEYACAAHWNECPGCRYIGPDKYHDKATSEETR